MLGLIREGIGVQGGARTGSFRRTQGARGNFQGLIQEDAGVQGGTCTVSFRGLFLNILSQNFDELEVEERI